MPHLPPPPVKIISGAKSDWEIVIGMEIHAQVKSNAKLFSSASTQFGAEPNSNVSFIDSAMPGMLPVINQFCVEQTVRTGLGLNAEINLYSAFDRKNYFYPDLPQGYQISQLYHPLVGEGEVRVDMDTGTRIVRVERIHLEQDAGKSVHDMDPAHSFVDLNRTGVALMEIVSRPDIRGGAEAAAYLVKMRQILRYLGTCDGNMQNGNMRADVNVSVCPVGAYEKFRENDDFAHLGTRCELKNMNSMRFIQQAIEYESRRQIAVLEDGGEITQETRLYDPDKGETRSMRSKEEAHDYRYFPDPDLLPLEISQEWVEGIRATLPELPDAKKARFIADYGVTDYDAAVLSADVADADYFEVLASGRDGKQAANWVINELFGRLNKAELGIADSPVSAVQLGAVLDLIADGTISGSAAKTVFDVLWNEGGEPADIIETRGLAQVSDTGEIELLIEKIITENPKEVGKAKENPRILQWFVGQVMRHTKGKANPQKAKQILATKLKVDSFMPNWGGDERYDIDITESFLKIMHMSKSSNAIFTDGVADWTGESLYKLLNERKRTPPEDSKEILEHFWRQWNTGKFTHDELQNKLDDLAKYMNGEASAKPDNDFWNK